MPLLTLQNAELAYGDLPLLDRASFALEERVLAEPEHMLPDGPSRLEGLMIGRMR